MHVSATQKQNTVVSPGTGRPWVCRCRTSNVWHVASATPDLWLTSQLQLARHHRLLAGTKLYLLVTGMCVKNLLRDALDSGEARIQTRDPFIALGHRVTHRYRVLTDLLWLNCRQPCDWHRLCSAVTSVGTLKGSWHMNIYAVSGIRTMAGKNVFGRTGSMVRTGHGLLHSKQPTRLVLGLGPSMSSQLKNGISSKVTE